ncbi:MAG: hypothetical protein LBP81_01040 [Treponema sp.]|jgi:hypothetical protein|nr:hypothetical protein [Treponema sp.]
MKKFFAALAAVAFTVLPALAQEFDLSGEIKTGIYWENKQEGNEEAKSAGYMHNNDDAGNEGRFRLNLHYRHDTIGVKVRFQETNWKALFQSAGLNWTTNFPYAFAYGNFLDDQLKISGGRLGDSPWGTGGPEMWVELDTVLGIRTEIKPAFMPGLNIGFVLNQWNYAADTSVIATERTLGSLLQESVVGASYDHEYFGLRFAYRLDSKEDYQNTISNIEEANEGEDLIYRVEERALKNLLPDFQIWANGHYTGINCGPAFNMKGNNWLYIQYAPALFTSQFRLGYEVGGNDTTGKRQVLNAKGSFYYNFLSFLSAGASICYAQDYGVKTSPGSPFYEWNVEPKVKVTFGGAYVEFVYHYGSMYTNPDVEEKTNWINLRLVYTF